MLSASLNKKLIPSFLQYCLFVCSFSFLPFFFFFICLTFFLVGRGAGLFWGLMLLCVVVFLVVSFYYYYYYHHRRYHNHHYYHHHILLFFFFCLCKMCLNWCLGVFYLVRDCAYFSPLYPDINKTEQNRTKKGHVLSSLSSQYTCVNFRWKEGNVLFNDALNTFYLRLYGVGRMVKNH